MAQRLLNLASSHRTVNRKLLLAQDLEMVYDGVMGPLKQIILTAIGILLVLIGIVGCFLPVVPGVALILLGLTFMGKEALLLDPIKRWLEKHRSFKVSKEK